MNAFRISRVLDFACRLSPRLTPVRFRYLPTFRRPFTMALSLDSKRAVGKKMVIACDGTYLPSPTSLPPTSNMACTGTWQVPLSHTHHPVRVLDQSHLTKTACRTAIKATTTPSSHHQQPRSPRTSHASSAP